MHIDGDEAKEMLTHNESALLRVGLRDEDSARRLASRAMMAKAVIEEWSSGESWDEVCTGLRAFPHERAAPFLAEGSTFIVNVKSFNSRKHSASERLDIIKSLEPLLPWRGKVSFKGTGASC